MPITSSMRALIAFLLMAFGFSWLIAEIYFRFLRDSGVPYALMGAVYMYGPAIAALVTVKWVKKAPLSSLGPLWRWHLLLLVTLALPALFALLALLLSSVMPGATLTIDNADLVQKIVAGVPAEKQAEVTQQLNQLGGFLSLILILSVAASSVIAGATINAVAAFGEELGWRGFLQKHLQHKGFWTASLLTGAAWGLWHLPLVLRGHNYPDQPYWGVLMMTVFCTLLSPLFAWWQQRCNSLLAPVFLHGALNATGGLMLFVSGSSLLVGVTGLAGLLILLMANGLLYWLQNKSAANAANDLVEVG